MITFCKNILLFFNPNPHCQGKISPHDFQRPITQIASNEKKRLKNIPQKMSTELMLLFMYPKKRCFMPASCHRTGQSVQNVE
jgi:hypothetical protein